MPNLYIDVNEQFELFSESIQSSTELCSFMKQCKKKQCKTTRPNIKVKSAIRQKKQALKRFREIPTASWK